MARFRERSRVNGRSMACSGWWEDGFKSGSRGFVFGSGSAAVEADVGIGAVKAAAMIFCGLLRVLGIGEEWSPEVAGDRG